MTRRRIIALSAALLLLAGLILAPILFPYFDPRPLPKEAFSRQFLSLHSIDDITSLLNRSPDRITQNSDDAEYDWICAGYVICAHAKNGKLTRVSNKSLEKFHLSPWQQFMQHFRQK